MRTLIFLIVSITFISYSCTKKTGSSETDKKLVETEIHQFMDSVNIAFETVSPEKVFSYFLHTDEFVVTTQGSLMTNSPAVLDTMKAHMAIMKKQTIKPVSEKIFVINKDAVVIST